jgi:molybdopterin-containing oxidoreductase family membrane subunit
LVEAITAAQANAYEVCDVYSPVPVEAAQALISPGRSPVRFVTFAGGLCGLVGGMGLAIITSLIWNLVVAGKPITAVVPFMVVGFEATILIGAISTLLGMLIFAQLPYRRFPTPAYRASFSRDRFGLWLRCAPEQVEAVQRLLEEAGAEKVEVLSIAQGGRS